MCPLSSVSFSLAKLSVHNMNKWLGGRYHAAILLIVRMVCHFGHHLIVYNFNSTVTCQCSDINLQAMHCVCTTKWFTRPWSGRSQVEVNRSSVAMNWENAERTKAKRSQISFARVHNIREPVGWGSWRTRQRTVNRVDRVVTLSQIGRIETSASVQSNCIPCVA